MMYSEQQVVEQFSCAKCGHSDSKVVHIAPSAAGSSRFLDGQCNDYLSVACLKCGFVELYNSELLGKQH